MNLPLDNVAEWKQQVYRLLMNTMDRRGFLRNGGRAAAGAALCGVLGRILGGDSILAAEAEGAKNADKFFLPRLKFDGPTGPAEWNVYPQADGIFRAALAKMSGKTTRLD
jgi:hypothetical protein